MRHPFTTRLWRMPNDVDTPPELRLDPLSATPGVPLVDPEVFDAGELIVSTFQQQRHSCAILNVCRMHLGSKDQAARVDEDVAFATIDAFGAIVAADTADTSSTNRLAVDDAGARLRAAANLGAELFAQGSVHLLPRAIQPPQTKVVIHGLPGRELVREQPPGAATPHHVEDGIQDFADWMEPGSAERFGWREQRGETSEFSFSQVSQVSSPRGQTPAILPAKPTRVAVFRQSLVSSSSLSTSEQPRRLDSPFRQTSRRKSQSGFANPTPPGLPVR